MRKLTDQDLSRIIGTTHNGYKIEGTRIKRGPFSDSDHYGIMLGKNEKDLYVSWQFHFEENGELSVYWGHYTENRDDALRDYNTRDMGVKKYLVTITETLEKTVEIEAKDRKEAEQIVSESWRKSDNILDADNFIGVDFIAVSVDMQED